MHHVLLQRLAAANGALSSGSVKLVVVALAFGRQVASPGAAPSGWWMMSRRSGAATPWARASMDRSSGASSAADPPAARRNDRLANL